MTLYAYALFVHIVGALLLTTAFTTEGIALLQLRRATTALAARQWEGIASLGRVFGPASVVAILASGLYMMVTSWGWVPWIAVGLVAWVLIAVLGTVNGIRMSLTLRQVIGGAAPTGRLRNGSFLISWLTRLGMAVGIVFVMTNKPDLLAAVLAVVVAAAIGAGVGVALSQSASAGATVEPGRGEAR